ncbi:MAG: hypothetical protein ACREQ5_20885, partial [Candidatus Dormibacteria bacterium]
MLLGIDTSFANYRPNRNIEDIDWDRVIRSHRFSFLYSRVGQGNNSANLDVGFYNFAHDAAKRNDLPFGSYYFFVGSQTGNSQADTMLGASDGRTGTLLPMIDVEEASFNLQVDLQEKIANLAALRVRVAKAHNVEPDQVILYTNNDTWSNYMSNT